MKRLVALAVLLLPLWGCAQPAEAPANAPANVSTNANATTTTATSAPASTATVSEAAITDQEKQIWEAVKSKNGETFGNMLTDDFVFISYDGFYDKAGTIKGIKEFNGTDVTFSDWKVVPIDADAAVVTYHISMTAPMTPNAKPAPMSLRASSVWVKRGGKWLGIFHQDTMVEEKKATSPAAATDAAKPANANANANANTPASEAAEAADPITKEKQVWEELKHKNWDAFASDLAENSIEVEPEAVYTKAGSVAGVKSFDATKFTLSEFKQVKIDADADIVTYMAKEAGSKSEPSRQATVWMKKGDKWLALFHQGTPQMKMPPPPPPAK
ncbi:MAG: DUF4440 domain-containing protein [Pyrinomonadaceae bacterium]